MGTYYSKAPSGIFLIIKLQGHLLDEMGPDVVIVIARARTTSE